MTFRSQLNKIVSGIVGEFDQIVIGKDHDPTAPVGADLLKLNFDSDVEAHVRIDGKAGALLTHISMMVAAASFMISGERAAPVEVAIIGIEIVIYLFLALCCIRCLFYRDFIGGYKSPDAPEVQAHFLAVRIGISRSAAILNFALNWTFFVTFLFMLSVLAHLFL